MDISVRTNISNEFKNIDICINAPIKDSNVQDIENYILSKNANFIKQIIGFQNNDIFILNITDIIMIYSEDKNNFCKTKEGIFKIKEKMYYLEENLPRNRFIRISNSAIINIDYVKCFNTSILGTILVKFNDGTETTVSRRRTSSIMKFLKERRD